MARPEQDVVAANGSADHAARADWIAAVNRRQGHQRRRAVGKHLVHGLLCREGLTEFCHGHRIGLVHGQQQPFGETARGTSGHCRWAGVLEAQGDARGRQVTGGDERDRGGRTDDGVRVWAKPAEQLRSMACVAVVGRDTGRNPDRRGAFRGIRGAEQGVRQRGRGRAVAGASQRVGKPCGQSIGARVGGRPVKPCGPGRLAAHGGGLAREDGGQPVVSEPVLGESQRELRRHRRHVEL